MEEWQLDFPTVYGSAKNNWMSDDWQNEARKRKLSNNKNTPQALKIKIAPKTVALYESLGVMNKTEHALPTAEN